MSSIDITLVDVDVAPTSVDEFAAKSLANAEGSRLEETNWRFDLLQSESDPTKFVLIEIYADAEGPKLHKETPHYLAWREGVADMMATPRKGAKYGCAFPDARNLKPFWNTAPANWSLGEAVDVTLVRFKAQPGQEAACSRACADMAAASIQEEGTLRCDVLQKKDSADFAVLMAFSASRGGRRAHAESPSRKLWMETLTSKIAEGSTIETQQLKLRSASPAWQWALPGAVSGKAPPTPSLAVPSISLRDGNQMPLLGFGCYKVGKIPGSATGAATASPPAPAARVIADALAAGYRCFDSAQFYENEAEIGQVLKMSGVPRSELFITSKVWCNTIYEGPAAVKAQCRKTIGDLQCEYLDMYMVHWPVPGKHVDAYRTVLELQKEGLIKSVGVSNYTIEAFAELAAADLPLPVANQIEINPFLNRKRTISHCEQAGIRLIAYRALCNFGKTASLSNEVVQEIAGKHKRTAAQVLGRWCVQKEFGHIPKSEKRARMEENADVFGWSLDEDDLAKLDVLTTESSLQTYKATHLKSIVRDTPLQGASDYVPSTFTLE